METNLIIAKFWTRVGAFFIDSLVIGLIGAILGFTIQDLLVRTGSYGVLIGLTVVVIYFTLLNSKVFKGQTPGKKALNIQVVDRQGNLLGLPRSLLRTLVFSVPYFLVNVDLPGVTDGSSLYLLKNLACISLTLGVIIIYVFNKGNRQSLHDLAAGSFVVSTERLEEPAPVPPVTKTAYYVFGSSVVLLALFSIFSLKMFTPGNEDLITIQERISNIEGVLETGITKNTSTVFGAGGMTTRSFRVQLWVDRLPANSDELDNLRETRQAVKVILDTEPDIDKFDFIAVTMVRGFNIGIASWKNSISSQKKPAEWRSLLEE